LPAPLNWGRCGEVGEPGRGRLVAVPGVPGTRGLVDAPVAGREAGFACRSRIRRRISARSGRVDGVTCGLVTVRGAVGLVLGVVGLVLGTVGLVLVTVGLVLGAVGLVLGAVGLVLGTVGAVFGVVGLEPACSFNRRRMSLRLGRADGVVGGVTDGFVAFLEAFGAVGLALGVLGLTVGVLGLTVGVLGLTVGVLGLTVGVLGLTVDVAPLTLGGRFRVIGGEEAGRDAVGAVGVGRVRCNSRSRTSDILGREGAAAGNDGRFGTERVVVGLGLDGVGVERRGTGLGAVTLGAGRAIAGAGRVICGVGRDTDDRGGVGRDTGGRDTDGVGRDMVGRDMVGRDGVDRDMVGREGAGRGAGRLAAGDGLDGADRDMVGREGAGRGAGRLAAGDGLDGADRDAPRAAAGVRTRIEEADVPGLCAILGVARPRSMPPVTAIDNAIRPTKYCPRRYLPVAITLSFVVFVGGLPKRSKYVTANGMPASGKSGRKRREST